MINRAKQAASFDLKEMNDVVTELMPSNINVMKFVDHATKYIMEMTVNKLQNKSECDTITKNIEDLANVVVTEIKEYAYSIGWRMLAV